jgi:hypothetical protein
VTLCWSDEITVSVVQRMKQILPQRRNQVASRVNPSTTRFGPVTVPSNWTPTPTDYEPRESQPRRMPNNLEQPSPNSSACRCNKKRGARPSRSLCSASRRTDGPADSNHRFVRCIERRQLVGGTPTRAVETTALPIFNSIVPAQRCFMANSVFILHAHLCPSVVYLPPPSLIARRIP